MIKTIRVNGKEKAIEQDTITYREVVRLAFGPWDENVVYSITARSSDGRGRILSPGQSMTVTQGDIFNVVHTGNA